MASLNILTVRAVYQPLNPSIMNSVHQTFLFSFLSLSLFMKVFTVVHVTTFTYGNHK